MTTPTDCAADLLAPPNCDLGSTPDVLFERIASEFAAPLARLVRAHEADPTLQQDLLQEIRKRLNYAIVVPGVLYMAWCCWRYFPHRPVMAAGLVLILLPLVYVTFRLLSLASAAQAPEDAGVLDSLSFCRRELVRQRDARRGYWRGVLLPLVPGLLTLLASLVLELKPIPWALVAIETVIIVGGPSLVGVFQQRSARRLQREIDALDSLVAEDSAR